MATTYIEDNQALASWLDARADVPVVALDTEFVREDTYYPILCLVQIGLGDDIALVSALSADLAPLQAVLTDAQRIKILHSGSQDLEVLWQFFHAMPQNLVDTQVAAALLGHGEQVGYANLVHKLCDVELAKSHTRFDWRKRPLPDKAMQYAAEDVRYLVPMWRTLEAELEARGRRRWLDEEQKTLLDPATYDVDVRRVHKRVKGLGRLKGKRRHIAQGLARRREELAMEYDMPRKWVLPDDVLLDLAARQPSTVEDVLDTRRFPGRAKRFAPQILAAVQDPPETDSDEGPQLRPLSDAEERLADLIGLVVKACADEADVAAKNLATRKEIERVARGRRDVALLRGWRDDIAGRQVQAVLEGAPVRYLDGRLVIGEA